MPNYYNPYNFFPATYQPTYPMNLPQSYMQNTMPMTSQAAAPQTTMKAMEWVEGEVGAKAFQMPAGWPANQPIPLWDSTDTIIFLKSWSPMGIPNPMQKLQYTLPEQQQPITEHLPAGQSGDAATESYASKDDIKQIRDDIGRIEELMQKWNAGANQQTAAGNQNGRNNVAQRDNR